MRSAVCGRAPLQILMVRSAAQPRVSNHGHALGANLMPLRDPVFDPPFNIVRASHVELGVADIARSRAFYVDCLGYPPSAAHKHALYLRGFEDRTHHSVVLRTSDDIAALAVGFKVAGEEDLDKAA